MWLSKKVYIDASLLRWLLFDWVPMSTSFHYNGTVTEVDAQSPLRIFVKTSSSKLQDSHAQALPVTQQALPIDSRVFQKTGLHGTTLWSCDFSCLREVDPAAGLGWVRWGWLCNSKMQGHQHHQLKNFIGWNQIFVKLIHATSSRELDCRFFLTGCLFFCCSELGQRFCEFHMYTLEMRQTILNKSRLRSYISMSGDSRFCTRLYVWVCMAGNNSFFSDSFSLQNPAPVWPWDSSTFKACAGRRQQISDRNGIPHLGGVLALVTACYSL